MSRQTRLEEKLKAAFDSALVVVENESHNHSVPPNSETHFKVYLVSPQFEGLGRVQRQKSVYSVLNEELKQGLHALSLRLLTPTEESKGLGEGFISPQCLGGSKKA